MMTVYVMKAGGLDMLKIGFTNCGAEHRRRMFQAFHWEELKIVRLVELGTRTTEADLHIRFARYRVRGEWFRMSLAMFDAKPEPLPPEPEGDDLREMIQRRGLCQDMLGSRIGLSGPQMSRIVRGKASFPIDKIESLAAVLSVPPTVVIRAAARSARPLSQSTVA